jgi:hypothetical protein
MGLQKSRFVVWIWLPHFLGAAIWLCGPLMQAGGPRRDRQPSSSAYRRWLAGDPPEAFGGDMREDEQVVAPE